LVIGVLVIGVLVIGVLVIGYWCVFGHNSKIFLQGFSAGDFHP